MLLDTNVLLDFIQPDRPGFAASVQIFGAIAKDHVTALICASSLKDVYYVARKVMGDRKIREYLAAFMDLFEICSTDREACSTALSSDEPDFEDGIIRAIAERERVDFIVTRDANAFRNAEVPAVSPMKLAEVYWS